MYCLEAPPMTTRQVQVNIYKKKTFFDWKKFEFVTRLVEFKTNISVNLNTVLGEPVSIQTNGLIFRYDSETKFFINERGNWYIKLHLKADSYLRLL